MTTGGARTVDISSPFQGHDTGRVRGHNTLKGHDGASPSRKTKRYVSYTNNDYVSASENDITRESGTDDRCAASCCMHGTPGVPGVPGSHGTRGMDGTKGERGEEGRHGDVGKKGKNPLQKLKRILL